MIVKVKLLVCKKTGLHRFHPLQGQGLKESLHLYPASWCSFEMLELLFQLQNKI